MPSFLSHEGRIVYPPTPLKTFIAEVNAKIKWSVDAGGGLGSPESYKLIPALGQESLFVADYRGNLYAFSKESGKKQWEQSIKTTWTAGVAIDQEQQHLIVGSSEGEVMAFDPKSGTLLWKQQVANEVLAPPKTIEDFVIVQSADDKIEALSLADGTRRWIYDRAIPALTLRGTASPAVTKKGVIAGAANGKVVALDLVRGNPAWESEVAHPEGISELARLIDIDADPVITADGTVYTVAFQGQTSALRYSDGEPLWSQKRVSSSVGMTVDQDYVYITDNDGRVWCLDRFVGAILWQQEDLKGRKPSPPISMAGYVVVGDYEGYLHFMDRSDGRYVGRLKASSQAIVNTPIHRGGEDTLYLYSQGGTLTAIEIK